MVSERFAIYTYDPPGPVKRGRTRVVFCVLSSMSAALLTLLLFPVGALAFLIPTFAWTWKGPRKLFVGPRYLLCGDQIFYYANVARVTRNEQQGTLILETAKGARFVLERDRFLTNARKPAKIAAHRAARFTKVAQKLMVRLQRAAPDVVAR